MSFLQQLLVEDYLLRLGYAQINHRELSIDSGYLGRAVFSGEFIFNTHGAVHKRNARVCDVENPCCRRSTNNVRKGYDMVKNSQNIYIIGLCKFSESAVNRRKGKTLLHYSGMQRIFDLPESPRFQQQGASPHWTIDVRCPLDTKRS